jgi:hypothetical protein
MKDTLERGYIDELSLSDERDEELCTARETYMSWVPSEVGGQEWQSIGASL